MRLVEEEHELRLVEIADFGKSLEELREQPQQKGRIQARRAHQPIGRKYIDHAALVAVRANEIIYFQRRLAEELVAALRLQHKQLALDGADARRRDIPVFGPE